MALFGRSTPADDQAIARYHYMLKTAPPETIEQAHAEAFARLTPEQRRKVLEEMGDRIPAAERAQVEKAGASPER
jgi:acyl-CoA reductase-like NAD-dependent aldehyde dehydrogenase